MQRKILFNFEKLDVWQKSKELVVKIYTITKTFPEIEKFGLCSQMQRSAISIASNIAEGSSRSSLKEQIRFTEIAYGSLLELYCQLLIANELKYITEQDIEFLQNDFEYIYTKLSALRNSQQKRLNAKQ
jgi:four helix bundle protein